MLGGEGVPGIISVKINWEEAHIAAEQSVDTFSGLTDGQIAVEIDKFQLGFDAALKINEMG